MVKSNLYLINNAKQFRSNQENVVGVCSALPLFKNLGQQLTQVSDEVYPLHPVMAAGLFGLSAIDASTTF